MSGNHLGNSGKRQMSKVVSLLVSNEHLRSLHGRQRTVNLRMRKSEVSPNILTMLWHLDVGDPVEITDGKWSLRYSCLRSERAHSQGESTVLSVSLSGEEPILSLILHREYWLNSHSYDPLERLLLLEDATLEELTNHLKDDTIGILVKQRGGYQYLEQLICDEDYKQQLLRAWKQAQFLKAMKYEK